MAFFGNVAQNLIAVGVLAGFGWIIYQKLMGGSHGRSFGKLLGLDRDNDTGLTKGKGGLDEWGRF